MFHSMENRIKTKEIPEIKAKLLKKQKNKCLVCKRDLFNFPSKSIHLHHLHKEGNIVGVLCVNCNQFEGRVLNWYTRTGLAKTKIDIKIILKSLIGMYNKKPTKYIHPTFKTKEEKKELAKKRRKRKQKAKSYK